MKKQSITLFLVMLLALFLTGCSGTDKQTADSSENNHSQPESAKRVFTDSAGRAVEIPNDIKKIAPSGPLAQIVLYTSSPDLLVGLASPFSAEAKEFIDEKYQKLPEFGQFYGKNASLNMEALSAAEPDVVIDIGEAKKTVKEDMDKLQDQLDIPTIFIEANLNNLPETYIKLGELLGNTEETEQLSEYCEKVLSQAKEVKENLKAVDQKSVYYASGNAGLNTNAEGSFHAQVIDEVGAKNAAVGVDVISKGAGSVVSMEQLIQWQPDYILADSKDVYTLITTDDSWKELTAVKENRVYQIPLSPYNFLGSPPSVNRIIGMQWLGQLIYPEQYQLDIKQSISEFYKLFYHVKPTTEQISAILENAQ
ncbi:ABC transporter substrate-binding protein [Enterococcus wangshanyuanii]|uniref:ABC transporter substrate-binding protein n=1 Tax=Enterococcus wangshanyuanii TaxID=2005703 RepID=A0ABQ1NNP2_9ENTE|nr:ABC transporter substrate-binding protein [Enterococcus wangshanyuanii]GGC78806.1 ABC transporter substrate-binding protein [Enterococcus wangshanyuanii]